MQNEAKSETAAKAERQVWCESVVGAFLCKRVNGHLGACEAGLTPVGGWQNEVADQKPTTGRASRYLVRNVERIAAMGGEPSYYDRAIVMDTEVTELHIITRQPQPRRVFSGTIAECWAWIRLDEGCK